jgi:hypothetical protein
MMAAQSESAMNSHRVGSFVLLGGGLVLVFAGVASALDYSWGGMLASAAAIAALLYAGGVWFAAPASADSSILLFSHTLIVASGPHTGRPIIDMYPDVDPRTLEDACRTALAGRGARFAIGAARFAASPVRSQEGAVVYGLLLSGEAAAAEASAAMPVA